MAVNLVTDQNIDPALYTGEIIQFEGTEFNTTFTKTGGFYVSDGLKWEKLSTTDYVKPYKSLVFKVNQIGTSIPTLNILENDFDASLTVTRDGPGAYAIHASNPVFNINKLHISGFIESFDNLVFVPITTGGQKNPSGYYTYFVTDASTIYLLTYDNGAFLSPTEMSSIITNGNLLFPEIKVYN